MRRMKEMLIVGLVACGIVQSVHAENKVVVYNNGFEQAKGLFSWPRGTKAILDTEHKTTGASSLRFTSDNNSVVYFYPRFKPGYKYEISLQVRANKTPLGRNGLSMNFNKKGGGNGSAGAKLLSFKDIATDNQWHPFSAIFVMPKEASSCQFKIDFYRTLSSVNIDDLKIYEIGVATEDDLKNATGTQTATKKEKPAGPFANGDFEQGKSGWSPWFKADKASWSIDKTVKHSGAASVLISGGNSGRHFLTRKVGQLSPGSMYKISFWAKTEDATGNPAVTFDFYPTNTKPRPYKGLEKMRGTKEWKKYTFYAEAPAGTKGAYLCLVHNGGKIWFDDITIEEEE